MFSVELVSEQIQAMRDGRLSPEDFEDWFLSESWGYFDVSVEGSLISVVHEALRRYDSDEIDCRAFVKELETAIRPFAAKDVSAEWAFVENGTLRPRAKGASSASLPLEYRYWAVA
jgi:hypothetical protein